jgi:hypothetical protein
VGPSKPVYTVPSNSTLMGSIAMTALIGRVPIDGTVNDPYPFKVLIGPDNLTANGIDIPDVAGAVFSGTASGDWTLSCVRGQIRSITFVFQDGTIRTMPEDGNRGRAAAASQWHNSTTQGGLGWISDPYGIPCVSGERRSNAQQYLGSQALITAAGAGVASLIKSDNGSVAVVANSNGSLGTVGISGNEAMGRSAGGVRTWPIGSTSSTARPSPPSMCSPAPRSPCTWNSRSPSTTTPRAPGQSPHRRRHASDWTESAAILLAVMVLGGCATSKDKLLPHGDTPCSTSGSRRRAAAPVAGRRRGNCSMRARACAGR